METDYDEYVSDPARPVPYLDKIGIRMLPEYMVADQRFAARRKSPATTFCFSAFGPVHPGYEV
jgi:hypothetical protein